jgi:uncharacterized coiled-coil protein SlyX
MANQGLLQVITEMGTKVCEQSQEITRLKAQIEILKGSNDSLYKLQDKAIMAYMRLIGWLDKDTQDKWFAWVGKEKATASEPAAPPASS